MYNYYHKSITTGGALKIKILYISDTHCTVKDPASRLDSYSATTKRKFIEIGEIIKEKHIELVIHGGDVFHSPLVSLQYAGEIANIIKDWKVPVYIVPGNHDMFGYNLQSINQTMLGMYANTKVVKLLTRDNPVSLKLDYDGIEYELAIEGQEFYAGIDKGDPLDYSISNKTADLKILAVHGTLLPKPFFPGTAYTLIKDVKTDADIVIAGHYHPGWHNEIINGTAFFNPGSLLRVENSRADMPKGIIYDIYPNVAKTLLEYDWEYVYLKSAEPTDKIFDVNAKRLAKDSLALLDKFKQTIQGTSTLQNIGTIPAMICAIAKTTSIDQIIVDGALKYIDEAQISAEEMLPEVKGFIEEKERLYITKVVIKNFQSHTDTIVEFEKGLNVISGESNMGKTSIMRAIVWCLYNDPKGNAFITTGQGECSVFLYFSNGGMLERTRTKANAGSYAVTKPDGSINQYSGFGNDIPIEVINLHQMPEIYLAKDFKCRLNIQSQLDRPFLVLESSPVKAAAIGRLIGTQNIDVAIKSVNSDLLGYGKDIKSFNKRIEENNIELEKYNDLEQIGLYIKTVEEMLELKDTVRKKLEVLCELDDLYTDYSEEKIAIKNELSKIPNYDIYSKDAELGFELQSGIETLLHLDSEFVRNESSIEITKGILSTLIPDKISKKLIKNIESILEEIEYANDLLNEKDLLAIRINNTKNIIKGQQTKNIEMAVDETEKRLTSVLDMMNVYRDYDNMHTQVKLYQSKEVILANVTNEHEKNIVKAENVIAELLIKTGSCPVCGNVMDEEHIKHVIRN